MWGKLLAVAVLSTVSAAPANATPDDPNANDWVAIALSPVTGKAGFGESGTREDAATIAMTQCDLLGSHCLLAGSIEYGCVGYVIDLPSHTWASATGPDGPSAINSAGLQMPTDRQLMAGSHCSDPLTPP